MPVQPDAAEVYSVSRLNREARRLLETGLAGIWVGGEISNLARPASGHMYFTLKDGTAQVRCALFRSSQRGLDFRPEDGAEVVLQGKVSIYEARGDYQIIVDRMEEAGEGRLRRAFEVLKARLDREGLFALEHKQPLPTLPRTIGVVTSPSGAAVRDVLKVLRRRYPAAEVIVYPTRVQGAGAAEEIVRALETAERRAECDVLILTRGGGSLEDLWSFNEEVLARAVFACTLPVVAGVGHEVDTTIADLVADARAPTPSAAAELVVPERAGLLHRLRDTERRLHQTVSRTLAFQAQQANALLHRLRRTHPGAVLRQLQQRLDELGQQLVRNVRRTVRARQQARATLDHRLRRATPASRLHAARESQVRLGRALVAAMRRVLAERRERHARLRGGLDTLSPLATLDRGYAIVRLGSSGALLRSVDDVKPGERIDARLSDGTVEAEVTGTRSSED